jgi:hypothetical protein
MLRSYGPRAHLGSWKTAGFENEPSLFYLYVYTVDNAQINENRGVEAGKLAEHDETR